jgi:membrane associated rhomboid family serine protease
MLPIRDTIRSQTFPIINWVIIGLNSIVFLFEVSLPPATRASLIDSFGLIPARLSLTAPLTVLYNPIPLLTLFTHMFLHAGWFHILSNMWVLYIFGDNVEDRMGPARYLFFYILSGLTAGLTQALIAPTSQVPAIGASGAIAGVLGAYFIMYPRAKVITLILVFFLPWFLELPAVVFLGFWFASQLFSGLAALRLPGSASMGGVAWWAHIGGFLFGLLLYRFFIPGRHPAYSRQYPDEYWPW